MPYVEIECPGGTERIDLQDREVSIGRLPGSDINRSEPMLSRRHGVIEHSGEGWSFRDLGSRNGTVINGENTRQWLLSNGDTIRIGDLVLRYIDPDEPPRRFSSSRATGSRSEPSIEGLGDRPVGPVDLIDEPLEVDLGALISGGRADEEAVLRRLCENATGPRLELEDIDLLDGDERVIPLDQLAGGVEGCGWTDIERVRIFRLLILAVLRSEAEGVEIEPIGQRSILRFQVDGQPVSIGEFGRSAHHGLVDTARLLSGLDLHSNRNTQEGEFAIGIRGGTEGLVRLQGSFERHDERVWMRLRVRRLNESSGRLEGTGLPASMFSRVRAVAGRDAGLLLVAGPPGSGRSTTLQALLHEIDLDARRTVVIDENIDGMLGGVRHHRVGKEPDRSYAGLVGRAIAEDPDVVFIGEIRDPETASLAVTAARRRHLVHAAVQAPDCIGGVFRMMELGVDSPTLASTLHLVLAQRIIRRLCAVCSRTAAPTSAEALALGRSAGGLDLVGVPLGCAACLDTGYRGRIPVFEMLEVDHRVRNALARSKAEAQEAMTENLHSPLTQSAKKLVISGETSFEEAERTTGIR